jgi:hypothetical protein
MTLFISNDPFHSRAQTAFDLDVPVIPVTS